MPKYSRCLIASFAILLTSIGCKKSPPSSASVGGEPVAATPQARPTVDATPMLDAAPFPSDAQRALDAGASTSVAPALPRTFLEFEALLLPLVREAEGELRSRKTCKLLQSLKVKSLAIRRNMPPGVDTKAWESVSDDMRGAFEGLGAVCTDDPPVDATELENIHQSYLRLVALLPK